MPAYRTHCWAGGVEMLELYLGQWGHFCVAEGPHVVRIRTYAASENMSFGQSRNQLGRNYVLLVYKRLSPSWKGQEGITACTESLGYSLH